jgi:hypothetical protein
MGQTCVCANRIMVQDGVYDEFANRFKLAVMKLKGDSMRDSDAMDVIVNLALRCPLHFSAILFISISNNCNLRQALGGIV